MVRFFGRYAHSLDPKGRVILPAKFRPAFDRGGYLTQYHEGCLALWTPERFDEQMATMEAAQGEGRSQRNLARVWSAGTQEVEVDRQGRVAIAQHLRDFARLDGDVLVNGAIDRVELWNPSQWSRRTAAAEAALTEHDQTEPDQTEPDQTEPDQAEPDQTEHDQTEPDQTEPDQTEPDQTEHDEEEREEERS